VGRSVLVLASVADDAVAAAVSVNAREAARGGPARAARPCSVTKTPGGQRWLAKVQGSSPPW